MSRCEASDPLLHLATLVTVIALEFLPYTSASTSFSTLLRLGSHTDLSTVFKQQKGER